MNVAAADPGDEHWSGSGSKAKQLKTASSAAGNSKKK
jgi:hypothetical protein